MHVIFCWTPMPRRRSFFSFREKLDWPPECCDADQGERLTKKSHTHAQVFPTFGLALLFLLVQRTRPRAPRANYEIG